jgi:hypothetical protein
MYLGKGKIIILIQREYVKIILIRDNMGPRNFQGTIETTHMYSARINNQSKVRNHG